MDTNFSFHCTICFEAFDSEERAPVVLPCGHTFICQQCSCRLDKCMECRYPLFLPVDGEESLDGRNTFHEGRPRHQRRNSLPSVLPNPPESTKIAVQKKTLPMPKNVVLISLMESSGWSERDDDKNDKAFENHDDGFVKKGIEQLHCDCGTYAVIERDGLDISEGIVVKESYDDSKKNIKEDDEESLGPSDILELNTMVITQDSFDIIGHASTEIKLLDSNDDQENKLHYGRTIQVVKFEDGKAKLARGAGSLEVKPGQLVKVGAARDKACQIEGRILSLKKKREEMELKMKEMDKEITLAAKKLSKATALPFNDCIGSESHFGEYQDQESIATTTALTFTASDDVSLSGNSFISDVTNINDSPRQQAGQEQIYRSLSQGQSVPNSPARRSLPSVPNSPARRSPTSVLSSPARRSSVDFNGGFSGYGFSGHRAPRRLPKRQIRSLSAY